MYYKSLEVCAQNYAHSISNSLENLLPFTSHNGKGMSPPIARTLGSLFQTHASSMENVFIHMLITMKDDAVRLLHIQ